MKTSNKILLILGIVPFIIILVMVFSLKNILDNEPVAVQGPDRSNYETEDYDLDNFEEIKAEGPWEIVLKGGDNFKIELETPPGTLKYISVSKEKNKLILLSTNKHFSILKTPRINITLPSLSEIDLAEGRYDVDISNLNPTRLNINVTGMASIAGTNSSVENLTLNGSGILNADFTLMPATNAYFNFNGVYLIMIRMNGGELSGILNGPGKLMTEGSIARNTIKTGEP